MEKLKFISFIVLCLLGINRIAYSQEQDTVIIKDSIAKMKLDKKLIKLAKQVVLKHGPEYYREYREPVIRYRRVSKAWNDLYPEFIEAYAGQVFYTVEYPYNEEEEKILYRLFRESLFPRRLDHFSRFLRPLHGH